MSRTKDHYGSATTRHGGDWIDATPHRRCPVCANDSWCGWSPDGAVVLCKRVASGREKVSREGVSFWVHRLTDAPSRPWTPPRAPRVERAAPRVVEIAYRALLDGLRLDPLDREALRARGLSDDAIDANEYRTLPLEGRSRAARVMLDAVGDDLAGVPGIAWQTEGARGWWTLKGSPGLLIPCRDVDGRVAALKVRRRDPCEGPRYSYLSSAKHQGASAANVVHVPVATRAMRGTATRLVLTEGELKADVSAHLAGVPVVSIPGVGAWAEGVAFAVAWGAARDVDVCFDMDALTKEAVALAARLIVDELRREGLRPTLRRWDPKFKGLDDYLVARRRGEVMNRAA